MICFYTGHVVSGFVQADEGSHLLHGRYLKAEEEGKVLKGTIYIKKRGGGCAVCDTIFLKGQTLLDLLSESLNSNSIH